MVERLSRQEVEELKQFIDKDETYLGVWSSDERKNTQWANYGVHGLSVKPVDAKYRFFGNFYGPNGQDGLRINCGDYGEGLGMDRRIKFPEGGNIWLAYDKSNDGCSEIIDAGKRGSDRVLNFRYDTTHIDRGTMIPYNHTIVIDQKLFDEHFGGEAEKLKKNVDDILKQIDYNVEKQKWPDNVKPEEACRGADAIITLWWDSLYRKEYERVLLPYVIRALSSIEPVNLKTVCPISKEKFTSLTKSANFYKTLDEMKNDPDVKVWLLEDLGISPAAREEIMKQLNEAEQLIEKARKRI